MGSSPQKCVGKHFIQENFMFKAPSIKDGYIKQLTTNAGRRVGIITSRETI